MLLSITLATYNVELFIRESIDSILSQTFSDFEIVCIDDASTDGTVEILQAYVKKDKRFRLILKNKNEGLSVARNECLQEAKGKYITFLDGDDLYDASLFEKAVALAEKDRADMVIWDYVTFYKNEEITNLKLKTSALSTIDSSDKIRLLQRPSFTWVKLLRTEKARELNIHFPPGFTRQDIPVHWHLITTINKVSILPERLSFYRQHRNATTAKKDRRLFHQVYVMDIVEIYLLENKLFETYKNVYYEQQLNLLAGMYDNIKTLYKNEAMQIIKARLSPESINYLHQKQNMRAHTRYLLLGIDGSVHAKIQLQLWSLARSLFRMYKFLFRSL